MFRLGYRLRYALAPVFLLAGCGSSGGGFDLPEPNDPLVQTQQVFAGVDLSLPTSLVQAPNDASRWFAIEKTGRIVVFDNDDVNATGTEFLDISDRVGHIMNYGDGWYGGVYVASMYALAFISDDVESFGCQRGRSDDAQVAHAAHRNSR